MKQASGFWVAASLFALTGVAAGAFGAHALRATIAADLLAVFETGVRYQMYHAFALFVASAATYARPSRLTAAAGWLFIVGIVVFSGSLYLLALSGTRWLGAITPIGGAGFLVGWVCLCVWGWRLRSAEISPGV